MKTLDIITPEFEERIIREWLQWEIDNDDLADPEIIEACKVLLPYVTVQGQE